MALDLSSKKSNWLSRMVSDTTALEDAIRKVRETATEYTSEAYNGGDLVNRAAYQITDADLQTLNFKHLDATKLNAYVGGVASVVATYDANAGVINAGRP